MEEDRCKYEQEETIERGKRHRIDAVKTRVDSRDMNWSVNLYYSFRFVSVLL